MQQLLMHIWQQHRLTVILVTHDAEEAVCLSDRIFVMGLNPGRTKECMPVPCGAAIDASIMPTQKSLTTAHTRRSAGITITSGECRQLRRLATRQWPREHNSG